MSQIINGHEVYTLAEFKRILATQKLKSLSAGAPLTKGFVSLVQWLRLRDEMIKGHLTEGNETNITDDQLAAFHTLEILGVKFPRPEETRAQRRAGMH